MKEKKSGVSLKDLLRWLLLALCGLAIGIHLYMANASRLLGDQMPMPFGYGAAVVLSGSMEPEFSAGDLILVKQTDQFTCNDIVVYQDGYTLVVHRVVEIDGQTVTTKGDANNTADAPIQASAVKGKVLFWIPYAGALVEFIRTPVGLICVLIAAIALVEIPRRNEKKKDDEKRQELLEEIRRLKDEL